MELRGVPPLTSISRATPIYPYRVSAIRRRREAEGARTYLLGRGLREETLREFRVGYAPSAWDRILTASRNAGYSEEELLAVGLVQRSKSRPGQVFDRFRERIMFPSADARGRVLGFGARAMFLTVSSSVTIQPKRATSAAVSL